MRWIGHLLFAFIAGALFVVTVLLYAGDPMLQPIDNFFAQYKIPAELVPAILFIVVILIWAKASSG